MLVPLAEANHTYLFGGKAVSLARLFEAGFAVPTGFVLSTDAYRSGMIPILEMLSMFDALGVDRVAVRSSATVEDGAVAAWAGQFETYLNVTRLELIARVQDCWASSQSDRTRAYCAAVGADAYDVAVAVIVQSMVPARYAGVAFSVHPVTGDSTQLIIESVDGLGDAANVYRRQGDR